MSNVFVKGSAPFYSVPQHLVNSGKLKKLSEGAHKLYQLILFKAQKHTRVALELSNREIHESVGLSANTVRRGRTELWEAGLIESQRAPGDRFTYVILNPLTGCPLSGLRLNRQGSRPTKSTSSAFSPSWADLGS
jgi:hypothetical protein